MKSGELPLLHLSMLILRGSFVLSVHNNKLSTILIPVIILSVNFKTALEVLALISIIIGPEENNSYLYAANLRKDGGKIFFMPSKKQINDHLKSLVEKANKDGGGAISETGREIAPEFIRFIRGYAKTGQQQGIPNSFYNAWNIASQNIFAEKIGRPTGFKDWIRI